MKVPIKLYLDEDALDRDLVKALRSRSVDVLTAQEAGLQTASDNVGRRKTLPGDSSLKYELILINGLTNGTA